MPYVINITYVFPKMRASIEPLAGDSRYVKRIISLRSYRLGSGWSLSLQESFQER
jgi:hypothetical protein